jgi:hypothetical protein
MRESGSTGRRPCQAKSQKKKMCRPRRGGLAPVSHFSEQRLGQLRAPHFGALQFTVE